MSIAEPVFPFEQDKKESEGLKILSFIKYFGYKKLPLDLLSYFFKYFNYKYKEANIELSLYGTIDKEDETFEINYDCLILINTLYSEVFTRAEVFQGLKDVFKDIKTNIKKNILIPQLYFCMETDLDNFELLFFASDAVISLLSNNRIDKLVCDLLDHINENFKNFRKKLEDDDGKSKKRISDEGSKKEGMKNKRFIRRVKLLDHLNTNSNLDLAELLEKLAGAYELLFNYKMSEDYYTQSILLYKSCLDISNPQIGNVYLSLAVLYFNSGLLDKSESFYMSSLSNFKLNFNEDDLIFAKVYMNLGNLYYKMARFELAREYYEKCILIPETKDFEESSVLLIKLYINYSILMVEMYKYRKAIEYCNKAASMISRKTEEISQFEIINIYSNLGVIYYHTNKAADSEIYYNKSLSICLQIYNSYDLGDDSKLLIEFNRILGKLYENLGVLNESTHRYTEAIDNYNRAEEYLNRSFDKRHNIMFSFYINSFQVYIALLNYNKCGEYLGLLEEMYNDSSINNDHLCSALYYMCKARFKIHLCNYSEVLEYLEKCEENLTKIFKRDSHHFGQLLSIKGTLCFYQNNFEKSLSYYEESLEIFKQHEKYYPQALFSLYTNFSDLYCMISNYEKSLEYLREANELLDKIGLNYDSNFQNLVVSLKLAQIYFMSQEYIKCEDPLMFAKCNLELNELFRGNYLRSAYHLCGNLKLCLNSLDEAESYYTKALDLFEQKVTHEDIELGILYLHFGLLEMKKLNIEKADEYFLRCETIFNKFISFKNINFSVLYCNRAILYYISGNLGKARIFYEKSIEIYKLIMIDEETEVLAITCYNYANLLYDMMFYQEAIDYYCKSIKIFEKFHINSEIVGKINLSIGRCYLKLGSVESFQVNAEIGISKLTENPGSNENTKIEMILEYSKTLLEINDIQTSWYYIDYLLKYYENCEPSDELQRVVIFKTASEYYYKTNKYNEAKCYLDRCITIYEKDISKFILEIADIYLRIANLNFKFHDYSAEFYFKKTFESIDSMKIPNKNFESIARMNYAIFLFSKGNIDNAELQFLSSEKIMKNRHDLKKLYKNISLFYEKTNRMYEALQYKTKHENFSTDYLVELKNETNEGCKASSDWAERKY